GNAETFDVASTSTLNLTSHIWNVGGSVIKQGGGTLSMSGANTYTGSTTVNGGTLVLGQINPDNEASTVSIAAAAGAKLDLAFGSGVTDTVGKLYIDGIQQPAGDYTSSHSSGAFAGSGTLHVNSGPAGFAGWQDANHTSGTINQDHDNDGVTNGIEYFLGGNTDTTGFTPLPPVDNTGGTLSVTWTKAATYPGTYGTGGFVVETSTTLNGDWATEIVAPNPGATVTITGNEVKYTFPTPLGSTKFARLVVTGP
ncbi:MAG: autotransporter-associated beta strand repeat-containing protein, partial [Verrucomicrobiota bacterium]